MRKLMRFGLILMWVTVMSGLTRAADEPVVIPMEVESLFEPTYPVGCCLVETLEGDTAWIFNPARVDSAFLPASTFKVFNSLVALQTGVIADENEVIHWDGVERQFDSWNRDQTLASAIRHSVVWAYQDLARRIGQERMQAWIDRVGYGNGDISGGIDRFWLDGGLRITARQQVEFLRQLVEGTLPFDERAQAIVRRITIVDRGEGWVMHAKTGWAARVQPQVGWYVGWVEREGRTWLFALNLGTSKPPESFTRDRVAITRAILQHLNVLPEGEE